MRIAQIVAMLDVVTKFPFDTEMTGGEMRAIVEMAETIENEAVMNLFIFEIAKTVDRITQKAEETKRILSFASNRYHEGLESLETKEY